MGREQAKSEKELIAATLQRLKAANAGNKVAYSRNVAPGGVFTDANGIVHTKAEMLRSVTRPQTVLDQRFTGIHRFKATISGSTAVINYILRARRVGTQRGRTEYRKTDTFGRRSGHWQLLAMQATLIPGPVTSKTSSRARLGGYVGDYRLSKQMIGKVMVAGGKLTLELPDKKRMQLVPQSDASFVIRETMTRVLFLKDRRGRVTSLILRKYPGGSDMSAERIR
jgi:hypothetical protein